MFRLKVEHITATKVIKKPLVPTFGTKFITVSVYIINGFTIFAARSNNFLDYAAKNL